MAAPDIFSTRYNIAQKPTPGFMDYAAKFLTSYLGAKKEKTNYEKDLFKSMASSLASTKQLKYAPEGGMEVGGQKIPWEIDTNGELNVPMDINGKTVNFPISSISDLNTLSTIRKREAPPTIPAGTAFQAALAAPDFWKRYKGADWQQQAAKDIYGLQQAYNQQAQLGSTEAIPATKDKHVYVGEYNGSEVYSNDNVNWYDADGNLIQE